MSIPTTMADLSTTANSNSPSGSENPGQGDDFLRTIQAILRTTNAKGADIASATTTDIGAATGEFVDVTGTTTITGLGTIAAGIRRTVRFTGALTLTHNGTSLILPSSANITTANGDVAQFRSLGSGNWVCTNYSRKDGSALIGISTSQLQLQTYIAFTTGGTSTAFTLTPTPAITANTTNTRFNVTLNAAPGASPTLAVSGQTAKNLKYYDSTGTKQFITSAVTPSGWNSDVIYDGTDWVVLDTLPASATSKIQPITATVAASALTITLSPTSLDFRSTTLNDGTVVTRSNAAAVSLVVPNTATLGTTNGVTARLAVLALVSGGVIDQLGVVNVAGGVDLSETGLISTTAIAAASNSQSVIYSTTARSNVQYRVVGYIDISEATAGTWATAPTTVQGAGGQALQHVGVILNGGSQSLTSGTSKDFPGIPPWVQEIIVTYINMSTNGTSVPILQIGDAGGIETSGYVGSASLVGTATANLNSGFAITQGQTAAYITSGTMLLTKTDDSTNTWNCLAGGGRSDAAAMVFSAGHKSLTDRLDRLRFTMVNGTDAFDGAAGSVINVNWK